jgi:hypothetical protein
MVQFGFHAVSYHPDAQPFFRRSEKPALSEVEGISRSTGLSRKPDCTITSSFPTLLHLYRRGIQKLGEQPRKRRKNEKINL